MLKRIVPAAATAAAFVAAVLAADAPKPALPAMKFDEVAEIAPGVYFRYSSISATDPKVPFGGSNHTWVVFKDYVVVVDANFPKEAGDVLAAIRKTTDKPIKYVLDTHHHGDHAYGNCVWAKAGAKIVAHKAAARLLQANGPKQWEDAAKGRKDVADNQLVQADVTFDDVMVLDDGTQRVEFRHFGHAHTAGDASAYLPKHNILCTGDACVNGAFNFMGHSNSASWVKALEGMEKLDVDVICPGHGPLARKDLLARQKRYFTDLRAAVKDGIDAKKSPEEIAAGLTMDWYTEWTGKPAKDIPDNVKHVYGELTGKVEHERLGAAPSPLDYYRGADPVVNARR